MISKHLTAYQGNVKRSLNNSKRAPGHRANDLNRDHFKTNFFLFKTLTSNACSNDNMRPHSKNINSFYLYQFLLSIGISLDMAMNGECHYNNIINSNRPHSFYGFISV